MKTNDPVSSDENCAVCGKDTTNGRGFMTLHVEGRLIALCCPLCQRTYQADPSKYLADLKTRNTNRDIERLLETHDLE
jgi:hypothetical protein